MRSSELKLKAKELLDGKKMNAAIMFLVNLIILGVVSALLDLLFPAKEISQGIFDTAVTVKQSNLFVSIIKYFVTIFLQLGMISYYMKIARGETPELNEIFSKGNIFLKAVLTFILAGLAVLGGTLLFIIPGIILVFSYSMIMYIYNDNPEIGITEVMKKSREMMKGHKWQYFCLNLSFIGWMLLTPFTLGILIFWLTPYMGVTLALFYDSINE